MRVRNFSTLILSLLFALLQVSVHAADNPDASGPVTVELNDKTLLSGILIDSSDQKLVLRTRDGEKNVERKNIHSIKPGLVPGKADGDDDLRIDKAGKQTVVDDIPDAPVKKPAPKIEKKDGESANEKLRNALKNGPNGPALQNKDQPPPAPAATPKTGDRTAPEKQWERGFAQIEAGDYKAAAQFFRASINSGNSDEMNKAEAQARQKFSRPLADVLVMCYATVKCPDCNGDGVLQCTDCNGTGYLLKNMNAPAPSASVAGAKNVQTGSSSRARVALCQKCHGNGFDVCMHCMGTGIGFTEPSGYERDAYTAYFTKMAAEALGSSETNYGDTAREGMPTTIGGNDRTETNMDGTIKQVWLRDSADRAKSDIIRLWRAEGFYRLSLKADPGLMIRSTRDLNQELIKIKIRRQNLYGELSERLRFKDFKGDE